MPDSFKLRPTHFSREAKKLAGGALPPGYGPGLSFLAQSDGEWKTPRVSVCMTWNFPNFWFLSHNFGSRYARKSIKVSKDSDDNLVYKKYLNQKMARWAGVQGQVTSAKKTRKHAPLWRHHSRPVATGGIRKQCLPNFFCAPQFFLPPEKFVLTYSKSKNLVPLKMYCAPPNLETWLRACTTVNPNLK